MYEHLNKAHLRGTVGSLDISNVNGTTYARFSLAVSVATPEDTSILSTTWFSVVAFENENIDDQTIRSLSKGCTVDVHGRFRAVCYIDSKGNDKRIYEVIAHRLEILPAAE